jgi:hypothetical protein
MERILTGLATMVVGAVMAIVSVASGVGSLVSSAPTVSPRPGVRAAAPAPLERDLPPLQLVEPAPSPRPVTAETVVLYGDSLAREAEEFFRARLAQAGVGNVQTRTFGGTAICDWFDSMRRDAVDLRPDVVVVEFSGNALTPCMMNLDGTALDHTAWHAKYVDDAREVLRIFAATDTEVYFAGAPRSRSAELRNDPDINWFNSMYAALSSGAPKASYLDAGASVLSNGRWTETLPCLPAEPCTGPGGLNVVRAPDGGHFCPGAANAVRGVTAVCSVWSSGAFRYGTAMADGVLAGPASFRLG